jgi:hypothetical protein
MIPGAGLGIAEEEFAASPPGPVPDPIDPEQEIAKVIAADAARMLNRLADVIGQSRTPGRAMRIAGAYIEANREVMGMLGLPDTGRRRRRGRGRGPFGRLGQLGVDFRDDDEEAEALAELGYDGPAVYDQGHALVPGGGARGMPGMVANDLARAQQLQALSASLQSVQALGDADLVARIRRELDLLLAPPAERGPVQAPAEVYAGPNRIRRRQRLQDDDEGPLLAVPRII